MGVAATPERYFGGHAANQPTTSRRFPPSGGGRSIRMMGAAPEPVPAPKGAITTAGATAIGVGGMMGAGLYTLLGPASSTPGCGYRSPF